MKNNTYLIIGLGFVSLWDTIMTIYGTSVILGGGTVQIVVSVLFGSLLTAFLIRTIPIIKNPSDDFIPVGAKILWFLAILYDVFTSFKGNFDLILGNVGGVEKVIIAVGLTLFVCSSPIAISKLLYK